MMPVFREREIDMVVWPWIKEIATHFERVEATLQQQQAEIKRLAERYHSSEKAAQMPRDQFSKEQRLPLRMKIERVVEDL
jgi:hypothetical protein